MTCQLALLLITVLAAIAAIAAIALYNTVRTAWAQYKALQTRHRLALIQRDSALTELENLRRKQS